MLLTSGSKIIITSVLHIQLSKDHSLNNADIYGFPRPISNILVNKPNTNKITSFHNSKARITFHVKLKCFLVFIKMREGENKNNFLPVFYYEDKLGYYIITIEIYTTYLLIVRKKYSATYYCL